MGPRASGQGDMTPRAGWTELWEEPQWGTAVGPWRQVDRGQRGHRLQAAMGPRPSGRGDPAVCTGFIVDTFQPQWGHGRRTVEMTGNGYYIQGGNVPQWATAVEPWRPGRRHRHERVRHAAMGPRPSRRGDAATRTRTRVVVIAPQWATAVGPWTPCPATPTASPTCTCRNGATAVGAVETAVLVDAVAPGLLAAMGPRPSSRGDLPPGVGGAVDVAAAIGSRTLGPWTLRGCSGRCPGSSRRNGATALGRGILPSEPGTGENPRPQWGPRPCGRGDGAIVVKTAATELPQRGTAPSHGTYP
jgi:hypothetical protein